MEWGGELSLQMPNDLGDLPLEGARACGGIVAQRTRQCRRQLNGLA